MKDFPTLGSHQDSPLIRKEKKTNPGTPLRMGLILFALFLVALFFVAQRVEYLRTERRIKDLMQERKELNEAMLPLKLEESYLTRTAELERYATERLGMRLPKPHQILMPIKPPEPKPSAPQEPEADQTEADRTDAISPEAGQVSEKSASQAASQATSQPQGAP